MPRLTRKSLADASPPSRSSPRASTKASTAAAGSSSPAKTRGRRSKTEEVSPSVDVKEAKPRGRSTSRGKASPMAGRQSRSRGRNTSAEKKKTSTPTRRGRGASKKETEDFEENEEEEEMEVTEKEEVTPKRGRSQSRGKGKSPIAPKPSTPSRGVRGSRRFTEETKEQEKEEPKKTAPRNRGKGQSSSSSTSQSRSRRSRGTAEPEMEKEEKEENINEVEKKNSEEEPMDDDVDSKEIKKMETQISEEKEVEAEIPGEQKQEAEKDVPTKEVPTASPADAAETKDSAVKTSDKNLLRASDKPVVDGKNGEIDDTQSPPRSGVKRKLEQKGSEKQLDKFDTKRARINGTESVINTNTSGDAEMETSKSASTKEESTESDILKDYVVVNKEEVPSAESLEVAASVPGPEAKLADTMEKTEECNPSSIAPATVIPPLTEAELAKAYASETRTDERVENDDISSTIVEVGSVAESDVTGSLSRGLDGSEVYSASNSVDGDLAADASINEGVSSPDDPLGITPLQEFSQPNQSASASETLAGCTLPVSQEQGTSQVTPTPPAETNPAPVNSVSPSAVKQMPTSDALQNNTSTKLPESSIPASSQNSQPTFQLAKGSSNVTETLGTPDPAFLAAYSSTGILNRACVSNPAVPPEVVAAEKSFSVVSYNILAECYRVKSDYSYTTAEFLGQDYRHALLLKELQYLNGDIVCLQEVSPSYFDNTLLPAMKSLGYDGLMKRRTKEHSDDGEATFYKTSLFDLESSKGVSLTEVAQKEVEIGGLSPEVGTAINKYLDRADVVLITRLRCKATSKFVTIGNIHVVWDNLRCPDVQCIQVACAIKEVVAVAGSDGAHIICGDFNSEWSSPVYQLVLDGYLSDSSIHSLQGVQRLELADGSKSLVNHLWKAFQHTSSNLKSAYSTVTKSEPEITTFTSNMKSSVDYVFYSASSLIPVNVLKTIDLAVVERTGGLPSKDFPSDHLAMKATIAFNK